MDYLEIPEKQEKGYLDILKAFRIPIPLATRSYYKDMKFTIHGELPDEIAFELPIFGLPGFLAKDKYGLNSGGRGVLLSNGKKHIRIKGCDLQGSITAQVAKAPNNHIADVRNVYSQTEVGSENDLGAVHAGDNHYELFSHNGKPFSFFTHNAARNEEIASEEIGNGFEKAGFFRPYIFIAKVEYPTITWKGQETYTLFFELPSLESDLRFQELDRHAFLHLKFASPEQLKDIEEEFCSFLEKLTTWYGFSNRILAENLMVPSPASHQHQNYTLCHVVDGMIGAARVDHTSTVIDRKRIKQYKEQVKQDRTFFLNQAIFLKQALELVQKKYNIDLDRYTGYFDRAYKWHQGTNPQDFPKTHKYINRIMNFFDQGWNGNPTPIPEQNLVSLINKISVVEQDLEHQAQVTAQQEQAIKPILAKSILIKLMKGEKLTPTEIKLIKELD